MSDTNDSTLITPEGVIELGDDPANGAEVVEQEETQEVVEQEETQEPIQDGEPSESAPETDKNDAIQKAINRKHFQAQQAKQQAEEERQRRLELEQKLAAYEKPAEMMDVPGIPDHYDPDYEQKMRQRDEILTNNAKVAAQQQELLQRQQLEAQQRNQTIQQQIIERDQKFVANAQKLNIKEDTLRQSENVVGAYLKDPVVASFLLEDANGPLLVDYLAKNVQEFDNFTSLPAGSQVAHIVGKVLPKALNTSKRITQAPEPTGHNRAHGGGMNDAEDWRLQGATFE